MQSCKKLPDNLKPKNLKKIDKISAALNLPTVATYNLRSMIPKINSLKIDILERSVDLGFLQETWEQKDNADHQFVIEKMLEIDGLQYISTPRPRNAKGRTYGGAAIVINKERFSCEKLNVFVPKCLDNIKSYFWVGWVVGIFCQKL